MLPGIEVCASKIIASGLASSQTLSLCCRQQHDKQPAVNVSHCWRCTGMSSLHRPL